jgi:acyl-coenzyme A synthetase/AMP-(fatty) acid ligase
LQQFIAPEQAALTYYSPGAGGAPVKARTVSHKEVVAATAAASKAMALTGNDVVLTTAPLWTFSGLTCSILSAGTSVAKLVLPGKTFNAGEVLKAAELHRPTLIVTTAQHAAAISAEAAADASKPVEKQAYAGALSSLRAGVTVTVGGTPSQVVTLGHAKLAPVDAYKGL